jgi:hypothetical protein
MLKAAIPAVLGLLLGLAASVWSAPIHQAIADGDIGQVRHLLNNGARQPAR